LGILECILRGKGEHFGKEKRMMRLLGMLVAVLLVVAVVGYFRGWFHVVETNADGQRTISVTVDKDKLQQDEAKAKQKLQSLEQK
jgi:hypothetical protein